jgi:hypothetical protein
LGPQGSTISSNRFFLTSNEKEEIVRHPPINIGSTWRNKRVGDHRVEKRINCFLVIEKMMEVCTQIRQWVGYGGEYYHSPIFLEIAIGIRKPAIPFKFNSKWLKEESFLSLVKEHQLPFDANSGVPTGVQFVTNLKRVKQATRDWSHAKR